MNKEAFDLLLSMVDTRTGKVSAERYYSRGGRQHVAPKPTAAATLTNNFAQGVGPAYGQAARSGGNAVRSAAGAVGSAAQGIYGAGQQARQNVAQGIASRAGQIADESRGIAGGIAGGARAVGNAAAGLGGSLVNEARSIGSDIAGAGRAVGTAASTATNAVRSSFQNSDMMAKRTLPENRYYAPKPAKPAPAPSYAQRGIPSSADLPPATPQPPQYFNDPRYDHKIDFANDLQRDSVKSFDQLPADFQARFRQRVSDGSVRGASDQDAVASYNRHYAGTKGKQLRALSQNPRTAYGTQPAPQQTFDQMAGTSPSPGNMAASRLPAASPQAVASR